MLFYSSLNLTELSFFLVKKLAKFLFSQSFIKKTLYLFIYLECLLLIYYFLISDVLKVMIIHKKISANLGLYKKKKKKKKKTFIKKKIHPFVKLASYWNYIKI